MDDLVNQLEKALEQSEQREAQLNDRVSALEDILYLTEANLEAAEQRGYASAMEAERKLHEDRIEELEANINIKADFIDATINQLAASDQRIEELEAERDAALVALFECMKEIDAYIQQEYPQDHPVHERYRQRDYAANPARMFLQDRPDAFVKARAMLAEADLKRQAATLKGQNDE